MKNFIAFFVAFFVVMPCASWGAVSVKGTGVKKAAPIATKAANKMDAATSLLPTVVGLVGSVTMLSKQQQQLTADCVPTASEIQLVDDLVKEWAKTGLATATTARGVSAVACYNGGNKSEDFKTNNETGYETFINEHDKSESCVETFSTQNSLNTIWQGFPKVSSGKKCDGTDTKNCKYVSNIYDIFALIPFGDEDYTKSEAAKISQFKTKAERCAPGKIGAAKRELYGNFVTQTLGNLGQVSGASGTASVLEAVSSMGGGGNIQSMLPSLGSVATQLLDK